MKIKYKNGLLIIKTQNFTYTRLYKSDEVMLTADEIPQQQRDDIVNRCNQIANLIYDLAEMEQK